MARLTPAGTLAAPVGKLDLATLKFDYLSPSVERIRGLTPEETLSLEASLTPDSHEMVNSMLTEELAREREPGMDPNRARTIGIEHSCKDGYYA